MGIKSVLLAGLVLSTSVNAATINFSGTLGSIEVDSGTSTYSGFTISDSFSGSFTYGNSSTDASSINSNPPNSADYSFMGTPYGGTITDGSLITTGTDTLVGIGDNDTMGSDATILNNLYGAGSTTSSTIADTWSVDSSNSSQAFGLTLYSLDTTIFSGLNFQVTPPALNNSDFAIFYIQEVDAQGNTIYLATGKLTSISAATPSPAVPIPAAAWLFGSGIIGLIGLARRKAA